MCIEQIPGNPDKLIGGEGGALFKDTGISSDWESHLAQVQS